MIDSGDLFMVQWIPGVNHQRNYLMMVIERHPRGYGWICEMCETGSRSFYYRVDIEEGKKHLEQYRQIYARVV